MLNAIGRDRPEHVDGYGRVIPCAGAFAALRPFRRCWHSWSLLGAVWEPRLRIIQYVYAISTVLKTTGESQAPKKGSHTQPEHQFCGTMIASCNRQKA